MSDTECLTVRGYLAYALCYVEGAFLKTGVESRESGMVLELLWSMVSCDSIGDWDNMRREGEVGDLYFGVLDHLESFHPSSRADALPKSSPLLEIDERIMRMIYHADDLAMAYMYGAIDAGAPVCAEIALKIAALGAKFGLEHPPIHLFQGGIVSFDAKQNDIWGDALEARPFREWVKGEIEGVRAE